MTDARLRGEWLATVKFDDLSDAGWRVFTRALMFCAENGTDGEINDRHLRYLHPDGRKDEANQELVRAGLWIRTPNGYRMTDWDGALGQSTAEQVEAHKENARVRARAYREKQRKKLEAGTGTKPPNSNAVTSDDARDVTRDVGEGEGEGTGTDQGEGVKQDFGWETAKIPGSSGWLDEGWVESEPGVFVELGVNPEVNAVVGS